MKKVLGVILISIFVFATAATTMIKPANGAGFPTVYAEFNSEYGRGIVEITNFGGVGVQSTVTARFNQAAEDKVIGFCLVISSQLGCQSRSSAVAGVDEDGCAQFTITFSEPVVYVGLLNEDFWLVYDLDRMSTDQPPGIGRLNRCR